MAHAGFRGYVTGPARLCAPHQRRHPSRTRENAHNPIAAWAWESAREGAAPPAGAPGGASIGFE